MHISKLSQFDNFSFKATKGVCLTICVHLHMIMTLHQKTPLHALSIVI